MNSETEDVDFPLTKFVLGQVAFDYIPRSILREIDKSKLDFRNSYFIIYDNGVESLQILLNNSSNQLRMYGTAKELADNLKVYRNFPFRHKVFGFDAVTPYTKKPTEFRTLKGEIFVRKDSFLRYFHSIVYQLYVSNRKIIPLELMEYMKNQEKQFYKCYEFMRYNSDVFDRKYQSEDEIDLKIFQKIINNETTIEEMPIVIRIFEDGPEKFVMKLELSRLNKNEDVDENTLEHETKNGILYTMELNEVFKTFRNQMNKIEFIRIPITRAKHAAVPIVTPSGDHCILAADALLEILRLLISALNIFQKVKTDAWDTVTEYISLLQSKFPFNVECRYFIDLNVYNDMKRETEEFWKKYDNEPAESVRDIGKDGFTVEDLKDELKYLGLTDVFPEITDYAENVYEQVFQLKKEDKLRCCDMFDALEYCQLICIFNRFPNLKKLLHIQKACHCIPILECEICSKTIPKLKFKKTKWEEYTISEVKRYLPKGLSRPEIEWVLECPNNLILRSNYLFFLNERLTQLNVKHFLMDNSDIYWALANVSSNLIGLQEEVKREEPLYSLANFSKCRTKKIYIRSIPTSSTNRVFTDEVLEIIPILLKQQGTLINASDRRVEKYRKKWKCDDDVYNSIDMDEFKAVLEEFDINKRLITIVPDPIYIFSREEMIEKTLGSHVYILNSIGLRVMDTSQAIFRIFQSVVCGVNWSMDYCKEHPNCIKDLKKKVIDVMKAYSRINKEMYVSCKQVEENIKTLQHHCSYILRLKCPPIICMKSQFNLWFFEHPYSFYKSVAETSGLPIYDNPRGNSTHIPDWMNLCLYMMGYIENLFFEPDTLELNAVIRRTSVFHIPNKIIEQEKNVIENILKIKIGETVEQTIALEMNRNDCKNVTMHSLEEPSSTKNQITVTEESTENIGTLEMKGKEDDEDIETKSNDQKAIKESETATDKVLDREVSIENPDVKVEEKMNDDSNENLETENQSIIVQLSLAVGTGNESSDIMEGSDDLSMLSSMTATDELTVNESECCSKCLKLEERMAINHNETKYETECTEKLRKMENTRNEIMEKNQTLEQEVIRLQQQTATDKIESARKQSQHAKEILTKNKTINELTEKNRLLDKEVNRLKQKNNKDQINYNTKQRQLEKKISESEKVINELAEKNQSLEQEVNRLEQKIITDQKINVSKNSQLEKEISGNRRINNEIMEKNRKLEQDIIHLHQKIDKDQVENAKQQSYLQKEIAENKRINTELKISNSNISIQNEKHEKMIQTLRDILVVAPSKLSNQSDQTVSRKEDETPSGMRFQLVGFQKIKDSLRKKTPLKKAENMAEKLISLTNRPEIRELADYELMQFEGKFRNYSQTVEMNIQKLKDTGHCKDLSPLPEFPSFSERFMKEYWNEMEKQPSTSSVKPSVTSSETSSELADLECLICTDPMESTENTIKCENCRRRFHSKCATEWFKVKRVCPACSRGLLDPSEFPSLGQ